MCDWLTHIIAYAKLVLAAMKWDVICITVVNHVRMFVLSVGTKLKFAPLYCMV